MKQFNIGIEITDETAMRALGVQRHLAQGHSEADFIAAETVLWPDQVEAYWLTVIADRLGAGRGFRFVGEHPELPPPSVGIPPNTIIVRCACGACAAYREQRRFGCGCDVIHRRPS
jgi:hypothetical protein